MEPQGWKSRGFLTAGFDWKRSKEIGERDSVLTHAHCLQGAVPIRIILQHHSLLYSAARLSKTLRNGRPKNTAGEDKDRCCKTVSPLFDMWKMQSFVQRQ